MVTAVGRCQGGTLVTHAGTHMVDAVHSHGFTTAHFSLVQDNTGRKCEQSCDVPEKAVEVSVPHIFEHHGQRLSVRTDAVESHDVLVLEHSQQLCLPLEVLAR